MKDFSCCCWGFFSSDLILLTNKTIKKNNFLNSWSTSQHIFYPSHPRSASNSESENAHWCLSNSTSPKEKNNVLTLIFHFEQVTLTRRGETLCRTWSLPLKGTQKIFIKDSEAIGKLLLVILLKHSSLSFLSLYILSITQWE